MAAFYLKLSDDARSALSTAIMQTKLPWDTGSVGRLDAAKAVRDAVKIALYLQLGSGWPITITRIDYGKRVSQPVSNGAVASGDLFVNVTFECEGHSHWTYTYA